MKRNIIRYLQKNKILALAEDLFYPRRCPICEKILERRENLVCEKILERRENLVCEKKLEQRETLICENCRRKLPYLREPVCKKCGKKIRKEEWEYCIRCENSHPYFTEGRSVFLYEKAFRRSVHRMKFQNKREYLDFYAQQMMEQKKEILRRWKPQVIVPIPMYAGKRKKRGYDQALLLAEKLADRYRMEEGLSEEELPVKELVVRIRDTKPQKELQAESRQKNLRGAFRINRKEKEIPARILLIDDIYTTGATMNEVSRLLRDSGAEEIYFLTLCSGRGL